MFNTISSFLGERKTMKALEIRALIGSVPKNVTTLIKVPAGGIVDACKSVKDPSHIVAALHKGASAHPPARIVQQQACDLHHLADCLEAQEQRE